MSKYEKLFSWFESNNIGYGRCLYRSDIKPKTIYYNYDFSNLTFFRPRLLNCEECIKISFYHGDRYLHENFEIHSSSEFCYIEIDYDKNQIACGKMGDVFKFVDFNDLTNKISYFIYELTNHDVYDDVKE
jgi:hypothetical protein